MVSCSRVAEPHDSQGILKASGNWYEVYLKNNVAEPHDSQGILKAHTSAHTASPVSVAEPHDSQGILKAMMPSTLFKIVLVAEPHDSQGILKVHADEHTNPDVDSRRRTPRFAGNTESSHQRMSGRRTATVAEPHDSQGILKVPSALRAAASRLVAEPHDSQGILKVILRWL